MGTEKGLFQDNDKFTNRHNELTSAFGDSKFVYDFLWEFLRIAPKKYNVELEKPVKSSSGFLYGFADCYINIIDVFNNKFNFLIEFKSNLNDYASTLRQIKTYKEYLGEINYTLLIVNNSDKYLNDLGFTKEFQDLFHLLYTQNIILIDYYDMNQYFGSIDHIYALLKEEEKEDSALVINAPIFIGNWQGIIGSFEKPALEANYNETYVVVSKTLTDPKYNIITKISDTYPVQSKELRKLLNIYPNIGGYFKPPVKCEVMVNLIEDSDCQIQQCITELKINGEMY